MAACPGQAETIERRDLLAEIADARDIHGGHQHEVGGPIDRGEGSLVQTGGGVDHDVGEIAAQDVDDLARHRRGHLLALFGGSRTGQHVQSRAFVAGEEHLQRRAVERR